MLWRDRNFATYWTGHAVSQLGDRVSELALPLIAITMLHAGPAAVGLLTAAVWTPNLLSLVVGAWVDDRPRKQRLLIVANLIQAGAVLTLPVAYLVGGITFPQLVAVALVAGAGSVLYDAAYPTFFVALVRRDQFVEANSLLSGTRAGSFIAGPPLAGGLIQLLTAPVAMVADGLSFLVSAAMIHRVRVTEAAAEPDPDAGGLMRRSRDGMRFLLRHPYLKVSLLCSTTINFCTFVVFALVLLYASRSLGLSAGQIGIALGVGAAGGLVGAATAGRVSRRIGVGTTIALGAVVFCAPLALLPIAGAVGPVGVRMTVLGGVEFLSGLGVMLFDVNLNALQTAVTPDDMRGRVAGAFSTVNYGIRPAGALLGGLSGHVIGVAPTIVVAAIGGALSVLWLLGSPILSTRTIEELEPVGA